MSQAIKAIIFDVGGVLVRTEDSRPRRRLAAKLNLSINELYDLVFSTQTWDQAQRGKITNTAHWQEVGRQIGLTRPEEVKAFRADFFAGDRLDQKLLDFILELRTRYKVAILSNAPGNLRNWIAREWEIPDDTFAAIVISGEEGVMKPHPQIYRVVLRRLGVTPSEAIFVDDMARNVSAAAQMGIHAVHYVTRESAIAQIKALLTKASSDATPDLTIPLE